MTDNTEALPPLPEPEAHFSVGDNGKWFESSRGMPMFTIEHLHAYARAALAQRQQVPEGWQLVPKVPTAQMIQAAGNNWVDQAKTYRAMLAAAPALTAAPSAQAEPVAWLYHDGPTRDYIPSELTHSVVVSLTRQPHYRNETPLYAAPHAAQAEPQESLDIAAIRAACRAEALEEAAQMCDTIEGGRYPDGQVCAGFACECAAAIRELK